MFAGLGQLLQFIEGTGPVDPRVLFERFFPPHDVRPGMDPFSTIEEILGRLTKIGSSLSLLALPAFLWFSTRLFAGIRTSLNHIYDAGFRDLRWRDYSVDAPLVAAIPWASKYLGRPLLFVHPDRPVQASPSRRADAFVEDVPVEGVQEAIASGERSVG